MYWSPIKEIMRNGSPFFLILFIQSMLLRLLVDLLAPV